MKKILLIYKNENLCEVFEKELTKMGFQVETFYKHPIDYTKYTFSEWFINKFRRVFLRDTKYEHKISENIFRRYGRKQLSKLKRSGQKFDYCLVVHGGHMAEDIISYARKISTKMIDYQPDGLDADSRVLNYHHYFDKIFVFDPKDVNKYPNYQLFTTTNFFIEDEKSEENNWDLFYIGAKADKRQKILENLHKNLKTLKTKFILGIYHLHPPKIENGIEFINKHISYKKNIDFAKRSKALIDIKRPEHDGLSFRFFEGLAYDKKVITNNKTAKNYDFYHPNNIYITEDFTDYEDILAFMNLPYQKISEEIVSQYNFKNWMNRMLND